jgi:hypothetical protein
MTFASPNNEQQHNSSLIDRIASFIAIRLSHWRLHYAALGTRRGEIGAEVTLARSTLFLCARRPLAHALLWLDGFLNRLCAQLHAYVRDLSIMHRRPFHLV